MADRRFTPTHTRSGLRLVRIDRPDYTEHRAAGDNGLVFIWRECSWCSALVHSPDGHTEWHQALTDALHEMRWGR
jgi:hypothetical protein